MSIIFERTTTASPDLAEFLTAHHADMAGTAPADSQHALTLDRLLASDVRLLTVRDGGVLVATGALAPIEPGHEELKSMRTAPDRRGQGWGGRMLEALLVDAVSRGVSRVSLETGSADFFAPAHALYARAGFVDCAPFADYTVDPHSTFMTIALDIDAAPEARTR